MSSPTQRKKAPSHSKLGSHAPKDGKKASQSSHGTEEHDDAWETAVVFAMDLAQKMVRGAHDHYLSEENKKICKDKISRLPQIIKGPLERILYQPPGGDAPSHEDQPKDTSSATPKKPKQKKPTQVRKKAPSSSSYRKAATTGPTPSNKTKQKKVTAPTTKPSSKVARKKKATRQKTASSTKKSTQKASSSSS